MNPGRGRRQRPHKPVFRTAKTSPPDAASGPVVMREQNSTLVLRLLWETREISRADLARRTGLSRSTISGIVSDLLETGLVREERAGSSNGGRRPVLLGFQDDISHLIGIDMGATHISVAVMNLRGVVRGWRRESHDVRDDPQGSLEITRALIRLAMSDANVHLSGVVGIGIGVPSPVSPASPGELSPLFMPAWQDLNIQRALQESFPVPIKVLNDANAGALSELWWGAGQDSKNIAYVKIATGVGAGLVVNGKVYEGESGLAGEIGHTSIDPTGPRCICGLNGCLNVLVGSAELLRRATDLLQTHPTSVLASRSFRVRDLVDAAEADDPVANEVLRYAGENLGLGVANLLNLINPDVVILSGGLTRAGSKLLEPLERVVESRSLFQSAAKSRLATGKLGSQGIAIGAATSVLEMALENPSLFPKRKSVVERP